MPRPTDARLFVTFMADVWDQAPTMLELGMPDGEGWQQLSSPEELGRNCNYIAGDWFMARRLGKAIHAEWRERRGDMPASLWQFPDGSHLILGDDGSWIL